MVNWQLSKKKRYPLTSVTWLYHGLKCPTHCGGVFWPVAGFNYWSLRSIMKRPYTVINNLLTSSVCWLKENIRPRPWLISSIYYLNKREIIIPTYILTLFLNSLSASSADTPSLRHSLTTLCFKASVIMLTVGCRSSISAISLFWCIAKGTVITLLNAAVEPIITAHLQRNKKRTFLIYSTCKCSKSSTKYNLLGIKKKIFCTGKSRFIIHSAASKSAAASACW